jgi:hypothetical protein
MDQAGEFGRYFRAAEEHFEAGRYPAARDCYLTAISAESDHVDVFRAILRVETIEEIAAGSAWYGPRPLHHAVCLLGSVSESPDAPPYLHNAFFGKRAVEAFQAATYLDDLLRLRRFPRLIQTAFLLLYLSLKAMKGDRVQFLELGSTLYAAYEKLANTERFLQRRAGIGVGSTVTAPEPTLVERIEFLGVELSDRQRAMSALLHPTVPLQLFATIGEVPRSDLPRAAFSLGVGNYAFEDTGELAAWLLQSRFTVLRERFTLRRDYNWEIMGKRFVCFALPQLAATMREHGYRVSLLSFVEAAPFLDSPSSDAADEVFLEAHLAVHDLTHGEMENVADDIRRYRLVGIESSFNSNPPIRLDVDILLRDLGPLQAQAWGRRYVVDRTRTDRSTDAGSAAQFDFTVDRLKALLKAHIDTVARTYPPEG